MSPMPLARGNSCTHTDSNSNILSKKSNRDSVEALLSDLDNLGNEAISSAAVAAPITSAAASSKRTGAITIWTAKVRQTTHEAGGAGSGNGTNAGDDAQSLLDDLDSLVQRRAQTPRRIPDGADVSAREVTTSTSDDPSDAAPTPASSATAIASEFQSSVTAEENPSLAQTSCPQPSALGASQSPLAAVTSDDSSSAVTGGGGWNGWGGSMWSTATKLADQARAEIEKRAHSEQAKELSNRGWGLAQGVRGLVKEAGLEKFGEDLGKVGKRGWTEVLNAVAPPISTHEVIQVTLSHDMVGFDGVEAIVFQVLGRVMESQLSRGLEQQLVVSKAPESSRGSQPSTSEAKNEDHGVATPERDMKAALGYEQAWVLAETTLSDLIAAHEPERPSASRISIPITYCPVFLRIQGVEASLPGSEASNPAIHSQHKSDVSQRYVCFLLLLQDPSHGLSHRSISQCFPSSWLSESLEHKPWIEQAMVDTLEGALAIIGQDYIDGRQSGNNRSTKKEPV